MKEIVVADIMTRDPFKIKPESTLKECIKEMVKKNAGSLLLVEDKVLLGMISYNDILWALVKRSPQELEKIKAIDISPRKTETIRPGASITEAINKLKGSKIGKLPVIQNNELVGIITIKDVLSFKPEIYPELEEFSRIREESAKMKRIRRAERGKPIIEEGICEECGNQEMLYRFNGTLICDYCMSKK